MKDKYHVRVLVCGGRDLNSSQVWNWLEWFAKGDVCLALGRYDIRIACIIQGGAMGADEGAKEWGESEHIPVLEFRADWKKHGKSAGPIRNLKMLHEGRPDVVIAFSGGTGTANMVGLARDSGIPVIEATYAGSATRPGKSTKEKV